MYGLLLEERDVWLLLEDRDICVTSRGWRCAAYN